VQCTEAWKVEEVGRGMVGIGLMCWNELLQSKLYLLTMLTGKSTGAGPESITAEARRCAKSSTFSAETRRRGCIGSQFTMNLGIVFVRLIRTSCKHVRRAL